MEPKKYNAMKDMKMKEVMGYYYHREEMLRLAWFRRNEDRLLEIANSENSKALSKEQKSEFAGYLRERFQNAEKHITPHKDDDKPIDIDAHLAAKAIMKPVDPEVKQLLYKGTEKEGRALYLKERYKIIPENRFYYPELTSFDYGWKTWDCAKEMRASRYGRQQVIRDSFYRRRGVESDPEWYREPAKLSPTTCGLF